MTVKRVAALLVTLLLAGCQPAPRQESAPGQAPASRNPEDELPLETESIGEEEVQTLEPQAPIAPPSASEGGSVGKPCAWSKAWRDPALPNPLLAGVGGAPNPRRVDGTELRLPVPETTHSGEAVVEIVIGLDGGVSEARLVQSFSPPWPDGEERIVAAVRRFRYEPSTLDGTPIAVCSTVAVRP